jgi:hypothetical protein
MAVEVVSPLQWAERQFGRAELGDARRTGRAVLYAAAAARSPSMSIPQQCGGEWARTKGAYRLFDMKDVTFDKLQQPHRQQTREAAGRCGVALWVHDTTTLSFDHPATVDLGPTSSGGSGQGMLLHTTMGVDVSGGIDQPPVVLGVGHQRVWVRPPKPNRLKPESLKWAEGITAVGVLPGGTPPGGTPPGGTPPRWVHVGDAESDCWEAIEACVEQGCGFAIRACQNRLVFAGHVPDERLERAEQVPSGLLFDLLRQEKAIGNKKIWVRSRKDRPARWAQLAVSAMAVTLLAPKNWSSKPHRKHRPRPGPIRCWAVRVYEVNAPAGEDPIEWVILTDTPVTGKAAKEAALRVAFWYSCRWLIEEYHKCLKTGCRVESRQLERASRLQSALGILAVVAVRLLQLKHQARVNPDAPADSVVPGIYVQTLAAYLKQKASELTAGRFWRETAKLGGFLCRKSDGDPGWLTLWRGWQHLETLAEGVELAGRMKKYG